jgi:hypothetical protein
MVALAVVSLAALLAPLASSQRKKGEDRNQRSVEGVVEDPLGNPVEGAVVQLKNAKTLQVRSFITQREGKYYFYELSTDVDYELKAEFKNMSSPVRRLTVFDTRRKAIINLKLEPPQ